jgi:hypothetical protein
MRNHFVAAKIAPPPGIAILLAFSFFIVLLYATGLVEPLGDLKTLSGWGGLAAGATLNIPGEATFVYPNGPRGQFKHGFRVLNDSAAEWQNFYGVQFEVNLPDAREVELTATIHRAARGNSPETPVSGTVLVSGKGWHTVTLPWSAFQFDQAAFAFLKYVKEFKIAARFADGSSSDAPSPEVDATPSSHDSNTTKRPTPKSGDEGVASTLMATPSIQLRNVRVVKAPTVVLECDVRGKGTARGGSVEYEVRVGNCSAVPQSVVLSFVRYGWEEMVSTIEPNTLQLAPGESRTARLTVKISDRVPPGGHEEQVLQAIANGDAATAARVKFITTSEVPRPFILHTAARWQEVRDKVAKHDWAKAQQADIVKRAESWQVPEVAKPPGNDPDDTMGPFLFRTQVENDLLACAYAWQLTHNKSHAEKVALFLRRLSNPTNGYPVTLRGCNQSQVQEGHFFQHIAMAYDAILDAGVLSADDRRLTEETFRVYIETIERLCDYGPINNWNLSEVCGAFYCALAMHDLVTAERFFSGPSAICDQLAKGVMDDGWWYECSIGYNMWCASEFTQVALAYEPFGVNFFDMKVPANFSKKALLLTELSGGVTSGTTAEKKRKPLGMDAEIYGPNTKPYRTIRDMWNSLLPFLDWRGVMFGVNDSAESQVAGNRTEVSGQPFEIAYYAFRDPAYAVIVKLGGRKRDLLYAVPELPEKTPEKFRENAFADNVGLVMLRSQTTNRPIREQIQATLHYGTHGWAHGHYDRTDLLSLMRYGRSFWNPESVFWVYEPFMYKFYCQCSVNHNMVVVDRKMQEATPGERLLFHTGDAMQATVVETDTRWSNPPYGGMVYDYVPVKTFAEKCWREGRSVPIPTNIPVYGSLTGFTEKIRQRRAMIVTDDYVVLADWVKGTNAHSFESLFQLKGFQGLEAPEKKFLRHDAQWNTDPIGSAQFVTDCDWYSVAAPAKSSFEMRWGEGADNAGTRTVGSEDGVLKLDVHTLWPLRQEIMVATAPEPHDTEKRLFYAVRGDGKTLAEGKFGAWILGTGDIDVPLDGVKQLELETRVEISRKPTVFWAGARIVTKDGKDIPLSELPLKFENIEQPKNTGKDYFGGPIKILGNEYQTAAPGQPKNDKQPGLVRVDLSGVNAVRFKSTLGSDYPLGNEAQRRKVYAIRAANGDEARFLTVIEPYEDKALVKSAVAVNADKLRVELTDGRVQEITLKNFDGSGKDIEAHIVETKDGQVLRQESTVAREAAAR